MESSGVVYEVDCNNCFKKYTGETGRKLKERMKEHKDDGEKSQEDKKITGFSQHMKTTGHSTAWEDVRMIYRENNWKKGEFKEAARIKNKIKNNHRIKNN